MSKILNKMNAATRYSILFGINRTESKYPANSSITMCPLSLPRVFSALCEVIIPSRNKGRKISKSSKSWGLSSIINKRPNAEPKVPGA